MDIARLYRIHEMIESETTGTPAEFAQKFNVKERQLYYLIEELRLFGAEVKYSRRRKTFYYANDFIFFRDIDYEHIASKMDKETLMALLKIYLKGDDGLC